MNKNKTHYFLCGYIIVFFFLCLCGTGWSQEKSLKKITYEMGTGPILAIFPETMKDSTNRIDISPCQ